MAADNPSSNFVDSDQLDTTVPISHRDVEYYIDPLIFQVENTIFRIPREYLAQESPLFLDMLQLPQPSGDGADGSTDLNPVILPEPVTASSFRALLKLLYSSDPLADIKLIKDEWLAILELARMWDMTRIRTITITHLLPLLEDDPAHQWNLAKKHQVQDWVLPALEKLTRRSIPLGGREFEMLDQEILLKVASLRECCYPVFYDSDSRYGRFSSEDKRIGHWEVRQERGVVGVDLSTFDFACPVPRSHTESDDTALESGGPWKCGEFYFEKVVFKVQDRLYRVPNQPFAQHSPFFRRQFENRGLSKYNSTDPFIIDGVVAKTDFENLLRFFFPPQILGQWEPTPEEWASILMLSARWEMASVKQVAVNNLQRLNFGNVATKLQMAQELGVQEWFSSGMTTLIIRQEPLAVSECEVLSQQHILKILDLRERSHLRYRYYYNSGPHNEIRPERGDLPLDVDISTRLTSFA